MPCTQGSQMFHASSPQPLALPLRLLAHPKAYICHAGGPGQCSQTFPEEIMSQDQEGESGTGEKKTH